MLKDVVLSDLKGSLADLEEPGGFDCYCISNDIKDPFFLIGLGCVDGAFVWLLGSIYFMLSFFVLVEAYQKRK